MPRLSKRQLAAKRRGRLAMAIRHRKAFERGLLQTGKIVFEEPSSSTFNSNFVQQNFQDVSILSEPVASNCTQETTDNLANSESTLIPFFNENGDIKICRICHLKYSIGALCKESKKAEYELLESTCGECHIRIVELETSTAALLPVKPIKANNRMQEDVASVMYDSAMRVTNPVVRKPKKTTVKKSVVPRIPQNPQEFRSCRNVCDSFCPFHKDYTGYLNCDLADLDNHIEVKHPETSPYKCPHCPDKSYKSVRQYLLHKVVNHVSSDDYFCQECGQVFPKESSSEYAEHIKKHGRPVYACSYCPTPAKEYSNAVILVAHLHLHHENKPFPCGACTKTFGAYSDLLSHCSKYPKLVRSNINGPLATIKRTYISPDARSSLAMDPKGPFKSIGPLECEICSVKTACFKTMLQHVVSKHKEKRQIYCEICGNKFRNLDKWKNHFYSTHLSIGLLNCTHEGCNKSFPTKPKLKKHMTTHSEVTPFVCDQCGKAYVSYSYLCNHIRYTHKGIKHYLQVKERQLLASQQQQEQQ